LNSLEQLCNLISNFTEQKTLDSDAVFEEFLTQLPQTMIKNHIFTITANDNSSRLFDYGCDYIVKRFSDEFINNLSLK